MDMLANYGPKLVSFLQSSAQFFLYGLTFWLLSCLRPIVPLQGFFKTGVIVDFLYSLLEPFYRLILVGISFLALQKLGYIEDAMGTRIQQGAAPIANLPIAVQILLFLLLTDFLQYWIHRIFHRTPWWKYHAIHHAPTALDWHHTYRFHPLNLLLYSTLPLITMLMLGFPLTTVLLVAPINGVHAMFVHSNLNITFGPFKYVLASPVFHRWHHSSKAEAIDTNFAPTFPFLDVLFGTFYMPKDDSPTKLGIAGNPVPEGFIGQIIYPWRQKKPN